MITRAVSSLRFLLRVSLDDLTICPRKAVPFTGVTGQTKPRCCPSVDTLVVFDRSAFGDLARRGKRASSRGRQDRRSRGARGRSGCRCSLVALDAGRTQADMHPPVTTANLWVECALFLRRASCAGLVPAARYRQTPLRFFDRGISFWGHF